MKSVVVKIHLLFLLSVWCIPGASLAQTIDNPSVLNQLIKIETQYQNADNLIALISNSTGYHLSYNPKHLKDSLPILPREHITVQKVIDNLFRSGIRTKVLDKQIIVYVDKKDETISTTSRLISGKIIDRLTQLPIPNAEISPLLNDQIFTSSNKTGDFSFYLDAGSTTKQLLIKAENYLSEIVDLKIGEPLEVPLIGEYVSLEEVIILSVNPYEMIKKAISARQSNYIQQPFTATSFFREYISKKNKSLGIAEAVFKLYKPGYRKHKAAVLTELIRGRKLLNYSSLDTIQFKTKGSVKSCIDLDLIQNPPAFLSEDGFEDYTYSFKDVIYFDDQLVYVIDFKKKNPNVGMPYEGSLYIKENTLAIKRIEFQTDVHQMKRLASFFVLKKPNAIQVKPKKMNYVVEYRSFGEKHILSEVRMTTAFKIKKKRSLFFEEFTTTAEMVLTTIDTTSTVNAEKRKVNAFLTNRIFLDEPLAYDEHYWDQFHHLPLDAKRKEMMNKFLIESE